MKIAIEEHESNLARIADTVKQKRQEMSIKAKEGITIHSSLADIPGSAKEDKQQTAEVDALWLKVLEAIQNALGL